MAHSHLEKLERKRKAEVMENPELQDARNERHRKQYAVAKQKEKGKKRLKKVMKTQRLKWRAERQNQKAKKQPEWAANLNSVPFFV